MSTPESLRRLPEIDSLRGLAALSVTLWHYQHFAPSTYPFADALIFFYKFGHIAVDFFFLLSGFIFFRKYAQDIQAGAVAAREFFWLRVSRLYPLHVGTLLLVTLLQLPFWVVDHGTFIYANYNVLHFVLNLLMLQYGWLEAGYSFNGPSWSLSIESVLYLLFFWVASRAQTPARLAFVSGALALFGLVVIHSPVRSTWPLLTFDFARGLSAFFIGGLLYRAVASDWLASLERERPRQLQLIGVGALVLGAWIIALSINALRGHAQAIALLGDAHLVYPLVAFPMLTLAALYCPGLRQLLALPPLAFLGTISYSLYLIHFPLQLAFKLWSRFQAPLDFAPPSMLAAYLIALVALSYVVYRFFEKPMMLWMRRRALGVS